MDSDHNDDSFVEQRSKRQKVDKSALFERIKKLKGSKNKYQITEVQNVYEVVDEKEYSKRVIDAKESGWIIDDGTGYVEDGREIFDDDEADNVVEASTSRSDKKKSKKKVSDQKAKGNIRGLIAKMPDNKEKNVPVAVSDDILDSLLSEETDSRKGLSKVSLYDDMENEKRAVNDYMDSFSVSEEFVLQRKKISKKGYPSLKRKQVDFEPKPDLDVSTSLFSETESVNNDLSKSMFDESISTLESKFPDQSVDVTEKSNNVDVKAAEAVNDDLNVSDIMDDFDFDIGDNDTNMIANDNQQIVNDTNFDTDDVYIDDNVTDAITIDVDDIQFDEQKGFQFYWLDAYEDPYLQPGVIFLFGKCRTQSRHLEYESCCVVVKNIKKTVYFLIKPDVEQSELIEELDLAVFHSRIKETQYKVVTKKYVFDPDVPAEAQYLEVQYPANFPAIDSSQKGAKYQKIFGANQNCLELFLLQKKIKGPCWLQIGGSRKVTNPVSHCKCEYVCETGENIEISEPNYQRNVPYIVALTVDLYMLQNPKTSKAELVMVSCFVDKKFSLEKSPRDFSSREYFCAFTKASHKPLPLDLQKLKDIELNKNIKFLKFDSERVLISCFLAKMIQYDPDIIIGHDMYGLKINMLCDRIKDLNIAQWSHLGRLRRITKIQKMNSFHLYKTALIGRLVCDLKVAAKDSNLKCRSYDLETLSKTILKSKIGVPDQILEVNIFNIEKMFSFSKSILQLMQNIFNNTDLIIRMILEIKAIPLALQITKIAGNILSATLHGGRSERNEFLLLHAFYEKNYIVPDKVTKTSTSVTANTVDRPKKDKNSYEGGLVLDPKVGLYDSFILLMDFNSLYPSIIQEFNICFTTIRNWDKAESDVKLTSNYDFGILPVEIQKLVEARKQVKNLLKTPKLNDDQRLQYNIRQMALKLTANSMYGCLGFANARFYAKHLAALITQKGREILMNTRDMAERLTYEVIYGDTDSIMINTNTQDFEKVNQIAFKLKVDINKLYRYVEIDIDGIYKNLLLLKKKKYAGLLIRRGDGDKFLLDLELKGLDMVRRDWSQISAKASEIVVKEILSDKPYDDRIKNIYQHMEKLKTDVNDLKIPQVMFEITKQITKDLKQYKTNVLSLPHVIVAQRLVQKNFRKGDMVSYVICDNGTRDPAVRRAYHSDELKDNENLKIDTKYYLSQQIFPVVLRLCEPVAGIDLSELAKCLDVTDYTPCRIQEENTDDHFEGRVESKPVSNKTFTFLCANCKNVTKIKSGFMKIATNSEYYPFLQVPCSNPDCNELPIDHLTFLENQLVLTINYYITMYYNAPFICTNNMCENKTMIGTNNFKNRQLNCRCCRKGFLIKQFTDEDLYETLIFLKNLFSLSSVEKIVNLEDEYKSALNHLESVVESYLNQSSYNVQHMNVVFSKYNEQIVKKFRSAFSGHC